MPTGYTHKIKDGISFKEFALGCARAFGACIEMRDSPADEPIPEKFVVSNYYIDNIANCEKELSITDDETLFQMYEEQKKREIRKYKRQLNEAKVLEQRYLNMIKEVRAWIPPTSSHLDLKRFMIKQLETSLGFDCMRPDEPEDYSFERWKTLRRDKLKWDLEYYKEEHKKEVKRIESRNDWIQKLRESLN